MQGETEALYEAWDRYKDLLHRCPQHGFETRFQAQTFYNGLNYAPRSTIDAALGGSITSKIAIEACRLFEELAKNNYQVSSDRSLGRRPGGVLEVDQLSAIQAQLVVKCKSAKSINKEWGDNGKDGNYESTSPYK